MRGATQDLRPAIKITIINKIIMILVIIETDPKANHPQKVDNLDTEQRTLLSYSYQFQFA